MGSRKEPNRVEAQGILVTPVRTQRDALKVGRPNVRPETEARIEHIAGLMRGLRFKTGVTIRELATEWGCSVQLVKQLSMYASRRVRAELEDPDRVVVKVCSALEEVIDNARDAMLMGGPESKGARRDIVEAGKTWMILVGAQAPTKVDIDVSRMSDEELQRRHAEVLAKIAETAPNLLNAPDAEVEDEGGDGQ